MKRKILTIVISLALLSSLFVFAAPVSAGNEGNANDNAGHFPVYITPIADGDPYNRVWHWVGKDDQIVHYSHDRNFFIETSIGNGYGVFHYELNRNFHANKRHGAGWFTGTIYSDYPDNTMPIGTLKWRRISSRDLDLGTHTVHTVLVEATGVFEGLHWSDINFEDEDVYEVFAHYAPRD
jgi:hypothetical protein